MSASSDPGLLRRLHRFELDLTRLAATLASSRADWPWRLCERLGFDRIGETRAFLRKPDHSAQSP